MSKHKYRGIDKETGEWVYGNYAGGINSYILTADDWLTAAVSLSGHITIQGHLVLLETVGEYSGLKDTNDKEIYEGDIIKSNYINAREHYDSFIETIVFNEGRYWAYLEIDGCKMHAGLATPTKHLLNNKETVYMDECEVIGNIHQNPELLEARG